MLARISAGPGHPASKAPRPAEPGAAAAPRLLLARAWSPPLHLSRSGGETEGAGFASVQPGVRGKGNVRREGGRRELRTGYSAQQQVGKGGEAEEGGSRFYKEDKRTTFQFLEQKYGYFHCNDCKTRWESAYVWCISGTNKSTGEELRLAWKQKEIPIHQCNPGSKMIQALLVTICLAVFPYQGSSIILESGNVNDYEVVYPQKVPGLPKGRVQNPQPETKYEDTMQYEFQVNGEPVVLHLERNKGLFSEDYTETHYAPDGREITTSPPVQDHCYYHGYFQNEADSSAVISACDGLKGHFKLQGETYFIEPLKISDSEAHAIYKDENVEEEDETPKICGVTDTTWESDEPIKKTSLLTNTPEQDRYLQAEKYIEFYMVVDNIMYRHYKRNQPVIKRKVYEMINTMNMIYRRLNFHIALIGLEIWSNINEINVQSDVRATLDLFGEWREKKLLPRKRNDNAQLLTGIDFNGTPVGLAYIGSICNPKTSVAVVQDYSSRTRMVAITMAHEMGHNLGMNHDRGFCTCGFNKCVMSTRRTKPAYQFSSCSVREHQRYLLRDRPQCILNKPLSTDIVSPPICGNYFVEVGEECDCGSPADCQSACCNATTCKLQHEAQCDSEECCEKCKFKGAGAECRAAKDDCDLPELCTGQSAECPTDVFQRNGLPCQNNQGYCYNGKCPIMTNQCIALRGPGVKVSRDNCFTLNQRTRGCGLCRMEYGRKIPCAAKDVKCGRLFCKKRNSMICNCSISPRDPSYGMVEPGTKCGDGMVCSNRQCVDVKTAY